MTFLSALIGKTTRQVKRTCRIMRATRALVATALVVLLASGSIGVTSQRSYAALKSGDVLGGLSAEAASTVASDFPGLSMKTGALVSSDGDVLWTRAPSQHRAIASITKIMTALVVMDTLSMDDTAVVPPDAVSLGESDAQLKTGETLSVSDLFEALLVKSGNDAAITLATRVSGSEAKFVSLMNQKAAELGLKNTHFANSHGLDEEGNFSTAEDLAVLARHAMTKEEFRKAVGLRAARIGNGKSVHMVESSNQLLGSYAGANGVKTGWTSDAGYSVVASAARNGIELTAVVLGTGSERTRFSEARKLLDWGFRHYQPRRISAKDTPAGSVAVTDFIERTVPVIASRDETAVVFDVEGPITRKTRLVPGVRAPVERGQRLGSIAITQGGRLLATVPVVAARDVEAPGILERFTIGIRRLWLRLTGERTTATSTALS